MQDPDGVTEGTVDDFASGDAVLAPCDDGKVHAFRVLDDGLMGRPACGAPASRPRDVEPDDVVCDPCIASMARFLESDVDTIRAAVREVMGGAETKGEG